MNLLIFSANKFCTTKPYSFGMGFLF